MERSKWEIIKDMLAILVEEEKVKKTRVMQKACLDWKNFSRHWAFLLETGFIVKNDKPEMEIYEITENGRELLDRLKKVDEMLRYAEKKEDKDQSLSPRPHKNF